ncbi:MAG: hypothetical protein KME26_23710 [Oscillatoria princeps RMCB-10]|jgi:hypothetical protein|nr:hypothetical protein [Oscillatoria princeps RMCB-10]
MAIYSAILEGASRFGNYLGEGEAFGLSIVGLAREILRPNASPLHNRDAPILNSCVIFPMALCDTLLRAAEANLYRLHFSQEILDGATRNLVNKGRMTDVKAARFQGMIKNTFPEAMVEVPAGLVEVMANHPGDRHVVAAAKTQWLRSFGSSLRLSRHPPTLWPNFLRN